MPIWFRESLITRRKRKDDQKNLELTLFRVRFSDGNFFQTVEQPTDYPLLISFSPGATSAMLWGGRTTLQNNEKNVIRLPIYWLIPRADHRLWKNWEIAVTDKINNQNPAANTQGPATPTDSDTQHITIYSQHLTTKALLSTPDFRGPATSTDSDNRQSTGITWQPTPDSRHPATRDQQHPPTATTDNRQSEHDN